MPPKIEPFRYYRVDGEELSSRVEKIYQANESILELQNQFIRMNSLMDIAYFIQGKNEHKSKMPNIGVIPLDAKVPDGWKIIKKVQTGTGVVNAVEPDEETEKGKSVKKDFDRMNERVEFIADEQKNSLMEIVRWPKTSTGAFQDRVVITTANGLRETVELDECHVTHLNNKYYLVIPNPASYAVSTTMTGHQVTWPEGLEKIVPLLERIKVPDGFTSITTDEYNAERIKHRQALQAKSPQKSNNGAPPNGGSSGKGPNFH